MGTGGSSLSGGRITGGFSVCCPFFCLFRFFWVRLAVSERSDNESDESNVDMYKYNVFLAGGPQSARRRRSTRPTAKKRATERLPDL